MEKRENSGLKRLNNARALIEYSNKLNRNSVSIKRLKSITKTENVMH